MRPTILLLLTASLLFANARGYADSVDQDGPLRDDHGKVILMKQADALSACGKRGMHLPTIRELVRMYQSAGLIIWETNDPGGDLWPVPARNPNGKTDAFYLDNRNYVRPSNDLGKNWFWSSSTFVFSSDQKFLSLNSLTGEVIDVADDFDLNAVRCAIGQ